MVGSWHKEMQGMFPDNHQEIRFSFTHMSASDEVTERFRRADVCVGETVIEYQHSTITLNEVNARNDDYENKAGKRVVWVIDCTQNTHRPVRVSNYGEGGGEEEEEVWILEFDKKWHIDSMAECAILFADFGDNIFRVPVKNVRHRMVLVFGSIPKGPEFVAHLTSPSLLESDVSVPPQSRLTVAQDPHGSGKTYGLTRMIIHTEEEQYRHCSHYRTFIVVTKAHSAKDVVYAEFMKHLRSSDAIIQEEYNIHKKYVVKFTRRSDGSSILCIFGTADSLMWNLADDKKRDTDLFISLVRTIHEHGPTKLRGPKGRMYYAGEQPQINGKTLLITDEATMLPEAYADAFATLMHMCHVDVHLAGDVQQSTYTEDNLLTKVVREYYNAESDSCPRLPSFPDSEIVMKPGNQVRRFNQDLVDFRNIVMRGFHQESSHNLNILIPEAAPDVDHPRGEFAIYHIGDTHPRADPDTLMDSVTTVLNRIEHDVEEYRMLPNDLLIVTPFVSNNPFMDQLRTSIEEFWRQKFTESAYLEQVSHLPDFDEIYKRARGVVDSGDAGDTTRENLPWHCVLHRSEAGKPIDTTESKYSTRIVSIHASQGDGRRVVHVIGVTQGALERFSGGNRNLKYESLLNVAISRMKEVVRVYLTQTYDDVWERFLPIMPEEMKSSVSPKIRGKVRFELSECEATIDTSIPGMQRLYDMARHEVNQAMSAEHPEQTPRALVDYAHHAVRMATANCVFHAKLLEHQVKKGKCLEQLRTVFKKVVDYRLQSYNSKEYYDALINIDAKKCIPVLYYNTGASVYDKVHDRIMTLLLEVKRTIKYWLGGARIHKSALDPENAVVMQYAVGCVTSGAHAAVKMDTLYDVVNSYLLKQHQRGKLRQHYDELHDISKMFTQVISGSAETEWSWKIDRRITLGMVNGSKLPHFSVKGRINHLYVTDDLAMPVWIVHSVDDLSMSEHCATALLSTLVCLQPYREKYENGKGKETWRYVEGREIRICFVPIAARHPVILNVTKLVQDNISTIADWVAGYIRRETLVDHPQALKMAEHYHKQNKFYDAVAEVDNARKLKPERCLDYIHEAFQITNETMEDKVEGDMQDMRAFDLERTLQDNMIMRMDKALKSFKRQVVRRD